MSNTTEKDEKAALLWSSLLCGVAAIVGLATPQIEAQQVDIYLTKICGNNGCVNIAGGASGDDDDEVNIKVSTSMLRERSPTRRSAARKKSKYTFDDALDGYDSEDDIFGDKEMERRQAEAAERAKKKTLRIEKLLDDRVNDETGASVAAAARSLYSLFVLLQASWNFT